MKDVETLKEKETAASACQRQYVIFDLGGDYYGIDVMKSQEVVDVENIRQLPDTLDYMRGVIDLRGRVLPVVDLKKKIGMRCAGDGRSIVIILQVHGELVGAVVDGVVDVIEIENDSIQHASHFTVKPDADAVEGIVRVNGRMVVIVDAEKILTKTEMKGLAHGA